MRENESMGSMRSQAHGPSRMQSEATITVQSSQPRPSDQTASPALLEIRLSEVFSGGIDGHSTVRALQARRDDGSASMVMLQRFQGKLDGRAGTFVLQGSAIVANGKITATWSVVPQSGTDELSGLRGEGGFEGDFGKGSVGRLAYWFEAPPAPPSKPF